MHPLISLNDRIVEAARAHFAHLPASSLYGRGVFTTLAVYGGRPFLWPQHWMRLVEHAGRVGLHPSGMDQESVGAALAKLIEANHVQDGRARVTLLASTERGVWRVKGVGGVQKTDLLIMTGEPHTTSPEGLALTVSPYRLNTSSPLTGIKSVNYLDHILAWEEARARDFDEAVRLNERGEIVSATISNLFWVTNGHIYTPALSTGALAGTTRARLIALAHELSIPIIEGVYELQDLGDADEIFLTSAGLGLAIVTTFDFHRYTIPAGSIALRLHEAFRQLAFHQEEDE